MRITKTHLRGLAGSILVVSMLVVGVGYVTADSPTQERGDVIGENVADQRDGWTVFTTQGFAQTGSSSAIAGVNRTGRVAYFNSTYHTYFDVDPSPVGKVTVMYVASQQLTPAECGGNTVCYRSVIERVNLTTGETTRVYEEIRPGPTSNDPRWHDVDRINDHEYLIADIQHDAVTVINVTSEIVVWEWRAQSDYSTKSGGRFPQRWTHLNDVEVVAPSTYMASLRNQDQVVFVTRRNGVQTNMTLGVDDNYTILREQHNPDYIPADDGGPAVVVADSGNDRVIEYERHNGTWHQTWSWRDAGLSWPRDADRLPNGHTLIADSNGGRILEIDTDGSVVWSVPTDTPYEVERLGTGDESKNGPAASRAGLESQRTTERATVGLWTRFRTTVLRAIPGKVKHGVSFVTPFWMGFVEVGAVLVAGAVVILWIVSELWLSDWQLQSPVRKR